MGACVRVQIVTAP